MILFDKCLDIVKGKANDKEEFTEGVLDCVTQCRSPERAVEKAKKEINNYKPKPKNSGKPAMDTIDPLFRSRREDSTGANDNSTSYGSNTEDDQKVIYALFFK
ncbi:hypothetical protein O0L34_g11643 [Tuta absoluta]|nr:hypothetical protein O0L34_g11643 [Tuta absoluta]